MADAKFTNEQLAKDIEAGLSNADIAKKYNCNIRTVGRRKLRLNLTDYHKPDLVPEGYEIKGHSGLYDAAGNLKVQWLKTKKSPIDKEKLITSLKEELNRDIPSYKKIKLESTNFEEDCLAVFPMGDPHIGMYASKNQTDDADWNLDIAKQTYQTVFSDLIEITPACSEALLANVGDLLHYDNIEGYTSRHKNILDRDGQYYMMFRLALFILIFLINSLLVKHKKVTVINAKGNHDDIGSICLSEALRHIYANNPRVEIQETKTAFNYYRFGKVLLGVHHGHSVKPEKLQGVMSTDRAKDWGETKFRKWLTGHIHQDTLKPLAGCSVETFRTLAPRDEYAHSHGYRTERSTQAILFHKERGEIMRHIRNIILKDNE